MAGQTPRFALNFFGGDTPGAIDDDNDKYTSEDRLTIDRLLAALENHSHRVLTQLAVPSVEPELELGDDGTLEADTTYYYVVSFIDKDGLESVSGPEVSIDTPASLVAPDAPQGETSNFPTSTLGPGLYYYALTALRGEEESALGEATAVTIVDDGDSSVADNQVTLTLPDLGDATHFQAWRMKDSDAGWTRIGTSVITPVPGDDGTTITDTGAIPTGAFGDPVNTPPTDATGDDTASITITLAGDDITDVASASGWRIYRSTVSGNYGATSLVHEVVERTVLDDPTSPLLISWVDDGDAALTGSPRLFSSELRIPPFTFEYAPDAATTFPDPGPYPENYPLLGGNGILYVLKNGAWAAISSAGGGGGSNAGVQVFSGHGYPALFPEAAKNDDLYLDVDTGDIYLFSGIAIGGDTGIS